MISEAEMQGLMDQLELAEMQRRSNRQQNLSPDEQNRLADVHRAFHHVCVRWAQEMGFRGGRF
jgi:hypothetical protein